MVEEWCFETPAPIPPKVYDSNENVGPLTQ